jgi:hypothetical protein
VLRWVMIVIIVALAVSWGAATVGELLPTNAMGNCQSLSSQCASRMAVEVDQLYPGRTLAPVPMALRGVAA